MFILNSESEKNRIGIIGGGSWGTALLKIISDSQKADSGNLEVYWWLRKEEYVKEVYRHGYNPNYLRGVKINLDMVKPMSDLEKVVENSDLLVLALPGAFIFEVLEKIKTLSITSKKIIVSIKGMLYKSNTLITDYLLDQKVSKNQIAVISGPCHAEEVALEKYSYLTVAAFQISFANYLSDFINTAYIKPIISDDVSGIQYSGILKNIIAVACGMAHGLGYGDNFLSVLVSNAQIEIIRFLESICPQERNLSQSVYFGDLLVTCYSQFSRNRVFGNMLGRGYSIESTLIQMKMVSEGYYATKCIFILSKKAKVKMPIVETIYRILYGCEEITKGFKKMKKIFV